MRNVSGAGRGAVALALFGHPSLWMSALRALVAHAPRRWWVRPPFLPLPDPAWWAFRLETAYGATSAAPSAEDVLSYLAWRKQHVRTVRARMRFSR